MGKEDDHRSGLVIAQKHGVPIYSANPSIPSTTEISKSKRKIGDEKRGLVVHEESGEVIGKGTAVFYEWEEVDKDRFVKYYFEAIKRAAGLSKSGLALFEIVHKQLQDRPGHDTVGLSVLSSGLKKTQFYNGLRELLEKEFLFRSPLDGTFFVNIRMMFNGDRLAFVRGFHLKKQNGKSLPPNDSE